MILIEGYWLVNGHKSTFYTTNEQTDDVNHYRKKIVQQNAGYDVLLRYKEKLDNQKK